MINKEKVKKNFGKAAGTYDLYARVQKIMSEELVNRILSAKIEFRDILEIGSGTGYLTELLAKNFPQANILAVDICPQMVEAARTKLSCYPGVTCLVEDGENLRINRSFDLIVSSAVFQ